MHELIGCGQLGFILCSAVIDGVIDAIITKPDDATPDGWQWVGNGVYRTGSAGTTMDATFYLAESFSFAKAGEPVNSWTSPEGRVKLVLAPPGDTREACEALPATFSNNDQVPTMLAFGRVASAPSGV